LRRAALLVTGIVALSLNLRPAVVAVGPLTGQISRSTSLGASAVSLLTTLPVLCFGVFAAVSPALGRRLGLERALGLAILVLLAGIALRSVPSVAALFIGSAVAGTGIAISNVLLPAIIKRDFPDHLGPMMAVYSVMLNGGAALAAGVTVPLGAALHTDWRSTLALWGLLAAAAALLWTPRAIRARVTDDTAERSTPMSLWRSRLAWAVAGFMGLQSLQYYAVIAWLPTLLQDAGMSESGAGAMVALMSVAGIAASFVVPMIATRQRNQRSLAVLTFAGFLVSMVGLLIAPTSGAMVWMIVLGIGQGAGISLAMTLFVLRSQTSLVAAELSGMAQTVGYLIAAAGPLAAGALHDISGGWTVPIVALIVLLIGLLVTGWIACADRTVEAEI
jgi:CP family cyanate transporter-like MFS transporter